MWKGARHVTEFEQLMQQVLSEGLAKIESLSDEEIERIMNDDTNK
jgi:hypothetical protein